MKRVSSLCATEPVPVQGHMTHWGQWSSERCLPHHWNTRPGFSEGTIQWLPVWEALVLCLIARLARQIKQPILLIGDLILYVTFLNFWLVLGFLMQEVQCFSGEGSVCTRPESVSSQTGVPLWGLLHWSQPTTLTTSPSLYFLNAACSLCCLWDKQTWISRYNTEPTMIFL